jgi:hypothetical protein
MHEQAAQYIANIATVVAYADGTTPETAYARISEEPTEANPTQGHEDAGNSAAGQGETGFAAAESGNMAEAGIDLSPTPITDSKNQLPTDFTPSTTDRGAGYNDSDAVVGEMAGVGDMGGEGTATNRGKTVTLYRVDDAGFTPRIQADGTVPVVTTSSGGERTLFVNLGQPQRAKEFAFGNRGGNATVTAVEVDALLLERLRASSVYDKDPYVKQHPNAPLQVDVNKAPDQFGLRTPEQIQWLRDAINPGSARVIDPNDL